MGNWRKYQGESHYVADHQGRRPYYKKSPLDTRQHSVPLWEKKFCASLGSVSWRKLLETKKYLFLHDNIVRWDDSAGREAFHNAKSRFWAEINGLPCDIPVPDPDIYIDDVDWNSDVDPDLILELETEPNTPTEGVKDEKVMILGDSFQLNQSFSCTGWGEAAEADISNWNCHPRGNDSVNSWEVNCGHHDYARQQYEWNCWDGWNHWEHHASEAQRIQDRAWGNWGTRDTFERKRERPGWYVPSHYRTSNLHSDDYQNSRGWRNGPNGRGRKRSDFAFNQRAHRLGR